MNITIINDIHNHIYSGKTQNLSLHNLPIRIVGLEFFLVPYLLYMTIVKRAAYSGLYEVSNPNKQKYKTKNIS